MAGIGGQSSTNPSSTGAGSSSVPCDEGAREPTAPEPSDAPAVESPSPRKTTGRPSSFREAAASHDRLRSAPPASGELSESGNLRESLLAARRYGATLNGLLSAIDVFARGVDGARMANDSLQRRVERIREQLDERELRTQELVLEVESLKARLRVQESTFAAERLFLTEGQDDFLRALLDEYEEELSATRKAPMSAALQSSAEPTRTPSVDNVTLREMRDTIDNLRAERERARALVQRMRAQRDGARAELRRISSAPASPTEPATLTPTAAAHPTTPAPPPFGTSQTPASPAEDPGALTAQSLDVVRVPRLSPPPAELTNSLQLRPEPAAARRDSSTGPAYRSLGGSHGSGSLLAAKKPSGSYSATAKELDAPEEVGTSKPPTSSSRPSIGASYRATPPTAPEDATEKAAEVSLEAAASSEP